MADNRPYVRSRGRVAVDGDGDALGTTANPVVTSTPSGSGGVTEVTEDAASTPNPIGSMLMARRRDAILATEVSAESDNIAVNADAYGQLRTIAGSPVDVITLTPTVLNADAYDAGDTVFDATVITNAVRVIGGATMLQSVVVADKDDQKAQLRLVFFDATVTFGTADAAPSLSDADSLKCLGSVEVLAADYIDFGGVSVATVKAIGLLLEATAASRDLYVAAMTSGTPTYTTGGLQLRFGFLQA